MMIFPCYSRFLSPRIVKTANTKTANSEGRLYTKYVWSTPIQTYTEINGSLAFSNNMKGLH